MITYASIGNIPFVCNNLVPGMITNFGGDTQVTAFDPDLLSGNQLNIFFNPLAQQLIASSIMTTNPMMTQVPCIPSGAVQSHIDMVSAPVKQSAANAKLASSTAGIQGTRAKLEAMLNKDGITDDEKSKINDLLKRLKEQEEKIKEAAQETNIDEKLKKANEIDDEIRKIATEAAKLSSPSSGSENVEDTEDSEKTDKTEETDTSDKTDKKEDKKEPQGGSSNLGRKSRAISDLFHEAVNYKFGTDNDAFKEACEALDEENITSVMKEYKDSYGKSFMKDFMNDANYSQKRDYGKAIMRTLRERAIELGIMDECKEDFNAINNQMDKWFWIDNKVYKNYDNIIAKIAEAEGKEYTA